MVVTALDWNFVIAPKIIMVNIVMVRILQVCSYIAIYSSVFTTRYVATYTVCKLQNILRRNISAVSIQANNRKAILLNALNHLYSWYI